MLMIDGHIPCPFIPDFNYRVKAPYGDFVVGEIVRFKRCGFDRYDNSYGYAFSVPAVPNLMRKWQSADATDWETYFEKIGF